MPTPSPRTWCALAGAALLAIGGCRPKTEMPPAPTVTAPATATAESSGATAAAAAAAATGERPALPGLQLYELRVEGVGAGSAGLPIDADALRSELALRLVGAAPFLCGRPASTGDATPPCPEDLPTLARTGVVIAATALAVDDLGTPASLEAATQVLLQVRVHAERGDARGRPVIGETSVEAPLPLPPQRKGAGLAGFLARRAVEAAANAASDAGGQLLVRDLDDATVRAWLKDEAPWRGIAALREVGERGLVDQREAVEAMARRSRPDLVSVAAATLGRIGGPHSVLVLVGVLDSASAEVCDAALNGLADLRAAKGDAAAAATAALRDAATQHPLPWIRQRARSLLGSGDGAGDLPAPAPPAANRAP